MKAKTLKQFLKKKEKIFLIDVREKDEYKKSRDKIKGSKNMPMGKVFLMAATKKLPKNKKIVAVCKSGGRGSIVARELRKKGYKIDYLGGGIKAWKD